MSSAQTEISTLFFFSLNVYKRLPDFWCIPADAATQPVLMPAESTHVQKPEVS